jgi:hypothetical protein
MLSSLVVVVVGFSVRVLVVLVLVLVGIGQILRGMILAGALPLRPR